MLRVVIAEDDFRVAQVHEKFLAKIKQVELAAKAKDCAKRWRSSKSGRIWCYWIITCRTGSALN